MGFKSHIKSILVRFFDRIGYDCQIRKKEYIIAASVVAINVGAGRWACPGWVNLDYPSEWYSKMQKEHPFKPYDMRKDMLPYRDGEVDFIYCSHVIEHIEDHYVKKFLKEAFRVLKKGGVIRVACPDADYLYEMTKISKDYWTWNKENFENYGMKFDDASAVDLLMHRLSTLRFIDYREHKNHEYENLFETMNKENFLKWANTDSFYDVKQAGIHINSWTFEKISELMNEIGFETVIHSRYLGSIRPEMRDPVYFDKTDPQESLYVEAIK